MVNVDIRASLHVKVSTGVIRPAGAAHAWAGLTRGKGLENFNGVLLA